MKEHVRLLSSALIFGLTFLVGGCGGGGGGDDDDGSAAGNAAGLAPQSISGRAIRLFDNNGTENRVEFDASGNQFAQSNSAPDGAPGSGTYVYTPSASSATLTLVASSTDEIRTFNLAFSSTAAGNYQVSSNRGTTSSGSFSLVAGATPPADAGSGSGQIPDPSDGPDPGPGDGGVGEPPPIGDAGLDGRVISMTRSTGQTHTYSFTGDQFVDSDPPEQGRGTYSFTRSGAQAVLILNYTGSTGPVNLAGDRHELQLNFTSDTRGAYTSTYTVSDGTVLRQDGTFEVIR